MKILIKNVQIFMDEKMISDDNKMMMGFAVFYLIGRIFDDEQI